MEAQPESPASGINQPCRRRLGQVHAAQQPTTARGQRLRRQGALGGGGAGLGLANAAFGLLKPRLQGREFSPALIGHTHRHISRHAITATVEQRLHPLRRRGRDIDPAADQHLMDVSEKVAITDMLLGVVEQPAGRPVLDAASIDVLCRGRHFLRFIFVVSIWDNDRRNWQSLRIRGRKCDGLVSKMRALVAFPPFVRVTCGASAQSPRNPPRPV